jgi:putative SOS response-associated peptidase YedK
MCYSAMVYAEIKSLERKLGIKVDHDWYVKTFWIEKGKDPFRKRAKVARAMEWDILRNGPPEVAEFIPEWDRVEISALEQEIFKQRRRVADGERALQVKVTKKAAEDVRIGTDKVAKALNRLDELKQPTSSNGLGRIYPDYYCPVVVMENGQRVVRPMRYRCRLPGWNEAMERKYPGTYNARRDNLEKSWGKVFGITHGVILATSFYEHVDRQGSDVVLEFKPQSSQDMIAACVWTRTLNADGTELLSFAAVTDDPPPEIIEAGHDRCIIPIKPESVDAWLQPNGDLQAMYAILDDRERPFYEQRLAA